MKINLKIKSKKTKGVIASSFVMFLQGWEGVILMTFALLATFAGIISSPAFAAASLFAKEVFTLTLSILIFGNKNLLQIIKKGFTKIGMQYSLGFIIGSSLGGLFYILAIAMAGTGYGQMLTSMYPVFTILIVKTLFKDQKITPIVWLGIVLTIIGGALFISLPPLLEGSNFGYKQIIGILFGAITALCWSVEGIIINKIQRQNSAWKDSELIIWKTISTFLFISIIIMPITSFWNNPYKITGDMFSNWKALLITISLSVNLIFMRILYTYSINNAGVQLTSIIDTNNFLVGPLISAIIFSISKYEYNDGNHRLIYESIAWWSWLMVIPILIGVLLVVYNSSKKSTNKINTLLDHEK